MAESLKDYDYNTKFKQEAGRIILNLYDIPRKLQNIITQSELKSDKEGEDVDVYEKIVIPISENFCKSINSTYSKLTRTTIHLDYSIFRFLLKRKIAMIKLERKKINLFQSMCFNYLKKD